MRVIGNGACGLRASSRPHVIGDRPAAVINLWPSDLKRQAVRPSCRQVQGVKSQLARKIRRGQL